MNRPLSLKQNPVLHWVFADVLCGGCCGFMRFMGSVALKGGSVGFHVVWWRVDLRGDTSTF